MSLTIIDVLLSRVGNRNKGKKDLNADCIDWGNEKIRRPLYEIKNLIHDPKKRKDTVDIFRSKRKAAANNIAELQRQEQSLREQSRNTEDWTESVAGASENIARDGVVVDEYKKKRLSADIERAQGLLNRLDQILKRDKTFAAFVKCLPETVQVPQRAGEVNEGKATDVHSAAETLAIEERLYNNYNETKLQTISHIDSFLVETANDIGAIIQKSNRKAWLAKIDEIKPVLEEDESFYEFLASENLPHDIATWSPFIKKRMEETGIVIDAFINRGVNPINNRTSRPTLPEWKFKAQKRIWDLWNSSEVFVNSIWNMKLSSGESRDVFIKACERTICFDDYNDCEKDRKALKNLKLDAEERASKTTETRYVMVGDKKVFASAYNREDQEAINELEQKIEVCSNNAKKARKAVIKFKQKAESRSRLAVFWSGLFNKTLWGKWNPNSAHAKKLRQRERTILEEVKREAGREAARAEAAREEKRLDNEKRKKAKFAQEQRERNDIKENHNRVFHELKKVTVEKLEVAVLDSVNKEKALEDKEQNLIRQVRMLEDKKHELIRQVRMLDATLTKSDGAVLAMKNAIVTLRDKFKKQTNELSNEKRARLSAEEALRQLTTGAKGTATPPPPDPQIAEVFDSPDENNSQKTGAKNMPTPPPPQTGAKNMPTPTPDPQIAEVFDSPDENNSQKTGAKNMPTPPPPQTGAKNMPTPTPDPQIAEVFDSPSRMDGRDVQRTLFPPTR